MKEDETHGGSCSKKGFLCPKPGSRGQVGQRGGGDGEGGNKKNTWTNYLWPGKKPVCFSLIS